MHYRLALLMTGVDLLILVVPSEPIVRGADWLAAAVRKHGRRALFAVTASVSMWQLFAGYFPVPGAGAPTLVA